MHSQEDKAQRAEWLCTHTGRFNLRLPPGQTLRSIETNGKMGEVVPATDSVMPLTMKQGTQ